MPNYSPRISAGLEIEELDFKVAIGASGAVGTVYQGKAGRVASVVKTNTGIYTVTLTGPKPIRMLYCNPRLADPSADGTNPEDAKYKAASYSASAGTFVVYTTVNDGTPALGNPADGAELHITCKFIRKAGLDG